MGFARFPWILRLIVVASLITAGVPPHAFSALIIRVANFCNGSNNISLASTAFIYAVLVEVTLANAASVSTLLLTSDALVCEKPKHGKDKKSGTGGDHDMY